MSKATIPDWGSDEGSSDSESGEEEVGVFEVDRIIAERQVDGATMYLVKWKEYEDVDCTWEPPDSFDFDLTISIWEKAREQGDVLDATEVQALERRIEQKKEDDEMAHRERSQARKLARKIAIQGRGITESTAPSKIVALPPPPSVLLKRKPSPLPTTRADTEPVKSSQTKAPPRIPTSTQIPPISTISLTAHTSQKDKFHALSSDSRQTGRRTTGISGMRAVPREGQVFRNLSHQNNAIKLKRQEPAPNRDQVGPLLPLADIGHVHDVALNLPSGPPPRQRAGEPVREVYGRATDVEPERRPERAAAITSPPNQQISHPMTYSAPQANQKCLRYGDSCLEYKWGELVVQIRLGLRLIGHVKIVGLLLPGQDSSPLIASLLRTKTGTVLSMTFDQEDAYNLLDYRSFAYEVSASGSLEPYDNAKDSFYELLTFLNEHPIVALVWRHELVPWTMVAYSSRSPTFVDRGFPSVSGGLAFVVCRRVPWHSAPTPTAQAQRTPETEDIEMSLDNGVDDSGIDTPFIAGPSQISALPIGASDKPESMAEIKYTSTTAQVNEKTIVMDPRRMEATSGTLTSKKQQGLESGKTNQLSFEVKYGMTFEKLARVPSTSKPVSGTGKFNRHMVSVFLAYNTFAEDQKHEEAALKSWLTTRTKAYMIYSSSEDHAWERYKHALLSGDHVGIILIHDDFLLAAFAIMDGLARLIYRENIQVFRVSLERPLEDDSISKDNPIRHFARIFPSGQVLLVTEAMFLDMPAGTAELMKWFTEKTKAKPNWRLLLRPQPQDFLQDLCETDISKEDRASHEKSLILLESLHIPSSRISPSPTSPYDDEESSSFIIAPLSLPMFSNGDGESSLVTSNRKKIAERDAKLIEYFCGWAFTKVSNFRRFIAITANVSDELRKRNSHVEFLTLAEFEKVHMMLKKNPAKVTPTGSPLSPVVKNAALKPT